MSDKVRHAAKAKRQASARFTDKKRSGELFKASSEQEAREVNQTIMPDSVPDLSISTEKLCFIVAKARQFDAKDVVTDPDDSSNATDDAMLSVLEDHRDDPVVQEIAAVIFAMSEDEQIDLVTLVWLGRGDGTLEDWPDLRAEAARAHNKRTASYLLGMPLLANHLEDALSQLGISCDE
jgi:Protein of unknown function (DUF3775)